MSNVKPSTVFWYWFLEGDKMAPSDFSVFKFKWDACWGWCSFSQLKLIADFFLLKIDFIDFCDFNDFWDFRDFLLFWLIKLSLCVCRLFLLGVCEYLSWTRFSEGDLPDLFEFRDLADLKDLETVLLGFFFDVASPYFWGCFEGVVSCFFFDPDAPTTLLLVKLDDLRVFLLYDVL